MIGPVCFDIVWALIFGAPLVLVLAVCRYCASVRRRRAAQRRRAIERATRVAARRIRARYQQAAWVAAEHTVRRQTGHRPVGGFRAARTSRRHPRKPTTP